MSIDTYNSGSCAVSWRAILAGAFAAAAASLALLFLGSGLGLSVLSPWDPDKASIASFTAKAAIWMIIMQWAASALGGYVAGRLRTKWVDVHTDEVFFRDTVHGFLSWAVATVFTAMLLGSVIASVAGHATQVAGTIAAGAAASADKTDAKSSSSYDYYIDAMFRPVQTNVPAAQQTVIVSSQDERAEVSRIIVNGMKNEGVPDTDKAYLAQVVANRTGVTNEDAAARVNQAIDQMNAAKEKVKEEADKARKAGATFAIFTFLSMLVGAFIASVSGAMGGRLRDLY